MPQASNPLWLRFAQMLFLSVFLFLCTLRLRLGFFGQHLSVQLDSSEDYSAFGPN
ncbi:hypothetical protein BDV40DRAFT_260900 [Aspergillus tamarii]|uniref:Uncharacterized protein n=1 Tax=Aspergillus tamarii TaxID=41984 RepID=A0A5N6V083_ASPTM|nr:hypothetical protein BDV40DRAFT_260900 [Aspergillus tamarii]